ncbi:Response regulator receiver domain-containing protein [Maridesulfovibrio ferrireducens]|uniref:Response regulator receiver domain-containing protein n=1 Tax=Maridesulfovibrio ferrireducens TaxID=246191 RepID=A0A1G9HVD7_9BACT|nr:response regulator [Maridesulfovibrio ferrireducens]SDL16948.1 Response regulator receiver domain-containing protein [Maridesulfovibrio ferrireducens]
MPRILVVDDDPISRQILRAMLEKEGHVVSEAEDGVKAVNNYDKSSIDLVITDIFMPEKEGVQTVRELIKENPDVKIIAVSGGSSSANYDSLDWIKMFGVKYTFTKPFDSKAIISAIDELLSE